MGCQGLRVNKDEFDSLNSFLPKRILSVKDLGDQAPRTLFYGSQHIYLRGQKIHILEYGKLEEVVSHLIVDELQAAWIERSSLFAECCDAQASLVLIQQGVRLHLYFDDFLIRPSAPAKTIEQLSPPAPHIIALTNLGPRLFSRFAGAIEYYDQGHDPEVWDKGDKALKILSAVLEFAHHPGSVANTYEIQQIFLTMTAEILVMTNIYDREDVMALISGYCEAARTVGIELTVGSYADIAD
jgi:hypothetical protein